MEWTMHRTQGEISLTLTAHIQGDDGVFWLYGGTHPHIGALCVYSPAGGVHLTAFPGHREEEIVRTMVQQLAEAGALEHIVACAGIHYDQIPKEWLPVIVALCRELGDAAAARLRAGPMEKEAR